MVTNITNLTSAETFYQIVKYTDDVTGGVMGTMFMIVVFIILVNLFLKRNLPEEALLTASFICFGLSIFLRSINLLSVVFIFVFGTAMALLAFFIVYTKNR